MTTTRTVDTAVIELKQHLETARVQSDKYLFGAALPVRDTIRAIVERETRSWWEHLTPFEAFLLFEISPATAARAPVDLRAEAFCAGVKDVFVEWWGVPGHSDGDTPERLIALGMPVARCLTRLFDDNRPLVYMESERQAYTDEYGWTVADIAAGLVANILGEKYDPLAAPDQRAMRRAEMRAKLQPR